MLRTSACVVAVALCACEAKKPEAPVTPVVVDAGVAKPARVFNTIARADFNLKAQERFLPLFWRADANTNKALEPNELVFLRGFGGQASDWVKDGAFTPEFEKAYDSLTAPEPTVPAEELKRREVLKAELAQGVPTLVETDTAKLSADEQKMLAELALVIAPLEKLYAMQGGSIDLEQKVPATDLLSRAVFHRNQSPACVAPKTDKDPACTALVPKPELVTRLYPAELQKDAKFCATLEKQKNKAELMDHFTVVVADGKGFKGVPYSEAFKPEMQEVATHLDAAAAAVTDANEAPLKAYLSAAANSFRTNDWESANVAWVAMSGKSKWYVRVAPDEVYGEPCSWKAAFALQVARINPESLAWQERLTPVKQDMEKSLAAMAGAPYKARDVQFKLPDFIDVIINAGDQRHAHGGTAGQSLPNWGKTAQTGGRTVVMTNLSIDADSQALLKGQMETLFCKQTAALASTDPKVSLAGVVLHEAAHNLGPAHDYKVNGKVDDDAFGGPLAATMEELKAQTSALYFNWWLVDRKVTDEAEAISASVREIAWAFGHVARGMYEADGKPKNYSQLASIQLGSALADGSLTWKADEKAANGADTGCFEFDAVKWRGTVEKLEKRVLMAKATGNKKDAEAMKAKFVDATDEWSKLRAVISERWLRAPKATYVYSY